MSGNRSFDIVIIGGGIIGNAIAFYLSRKSKARIAVLEQYVLNSGSTSVAGSLITKLRHQKSLIPLVEETYRAVSDIKLITGKSLKEHKVGCMHLSTSADTSEWLSALRKTAGEFNIHTEMLDEFVLETRVPWLDPTFIDQALFVPDEIYVDSTKLGMAYVNIARENGVTFKINTHVSEVLLNKEKVCGVMANGEAINSPVVIDAAGIWANLILEKMGIWVPSVPIRSLYFLTVSDSEVFPEDHPVCVFPDINTFTRPHQGALLIGIRDSASTYIQPHHLPRIIGNKEYITGNEIWNVLKNEAVYIRKLMRDPGDFEISHWVAAPCAYTPDGNPVIGRLMPYEGLYAATGCCGSGIAASAGIGRLMAEIILNEPAFTRVEDFSPARLSGQNPYSPEFMQKCSDQRSNRKAVLYDLES